MVPAWLSRGDIHSAVSFLALEKPDDTAHILYLVPPLSRFIAFESRRRRSSE